jgi:hypothetical protein
MALPLHHDGIASGNAFQNKRGDILCKIWPKLKDNSHL